MAGVILAVTVVAEGQEATAPTSVIRVIADLDDDDRDGVVDGAQPEHVPVDALVDVTRVARDLRQSPPGSAPVRLVSGGRVIAPDGPIPQGRAVSLQAKRAGRFELGGKGGVEVRAIEVGAVGASGEVFDLASEHVTISRTPPRSAPTSADHAPNDPDAARLFVRGHPDDLPRVLSVISRSERGELLDVLRDVDLVRGPCPPEAPGGAPSAGELACAVSTPLRAVVDVIDRAHPLARERSVQVELGGALELVAEDGGKLQTVRVGGPRLERGWVERFRVGLRVFVVRATAGGAPPVGGQDDAALRVAHEEVRRASAMWSACGLSFGPPERLDIRLVDPPPPHLVAVGCGYGFKASGGQVRLSVDGREVKALVAAGATPREAARPIAAAIGAAGFVVTVSENRPLWAGALETVDLLVRRPRGGPATVTAPISTDATLGVCVGSVDLTDGLSHFTDADSIAGTLEERTLIKAYDDGDPATVDVYVIPSFQGGDRIGESFIHGDGGAIRNTVLEDRGAIRADRASHALAHELGHVLLDEPGHPDDFSVDTPTLLMDADAADASAFGPRRIDLASCERAIRQGGDADRRRAGAGWLTPWPLVAMPRAR